MNDKIQWKVINLEEIFKKIVAENGVSLKNAKPEDAKTEFEKKILNASYKDIKKEYFKKESCQVCNENHYDELFLIYQESKEISSKKRQNTPILFRWGMNVSFLIIRFSFLLIYILYYDIINLLNFKERRNIMYKIYQMELSEKQSLYPYFQEICSQYKNLYNVTNYYIRQCMTGLKKAPHKRQPNEIEVLHTVFNELSKVNELKKKGTYEYPTHDKWFLNYYLLDGLFKVTQNSDYLSLPSQVNQNAIKDCVGNWQSYFKALKSYHKNPSKFTGKPKIIHYKKNAEMTATFTNIVCKLQRNENGKVYVRFPKTTHKLWLGKIPIEIMNLKEVTVSPYYGHYKVNLVYETDEHEVKDHLDPTRAIAIDLGVNNIATITNNIEFPSIIVKGKYLKSQNQYFNKQQAHYYRLLRQGMNPKEGTFTSKRLQQLGLHRNRYFHDQFHKISKKIIMYCVKHKIGTLIVGKNEFWKQKVKLHKVVKQNFVQIPYQQFLKMLQYQCEREGINYVEQEESYTSKADFFANDEIPNYKKGSSVKYVFSGKRISRGLYQSQDESILNADINGSANILRKYSSTAFNHLISRDYIKRVELWNYEYVNS